MDHRQRRAAGGEDSSLTDTGSVQLEQQAKVMYTDTTSTTSMHTRASQEPEGSRQLDDGNVKLAHGKVCHFDRY